VEEIKGWRRLRGDYMYDRTCCLGGRCVIHGIPGCGLSGCILNRRQLDEMRRIEGH
jgi:hypothetical protein